MGEGVVQKIWPTLYPGCRYNVELFLREEVGGVCVCVCVCYLWWPSREHAIGDMASKQAEFCEGNLIVSTKGA